MANLKNKFDAAVIGAGPSGIAAANDLARKGFNVIIIEKRPRLGLPVRCAEFVPKQLYTYCKIPKNSIAQEIENLETHMPDDSIVITKSPGYILNRHLFENHYLQEALANGATLALESEVIYVNHNQLLVKTKTRTRSIEASYIIGADGPLSAARKYITSNKIQLAQSLQGVITLKTHQANSKVFFHPDYYMGYGWLFPKGATANLGLGVSYRPGISINDIWSKFLERLKIDNASLKSLTGGLIPVSGLMKNIAKNNVLLVGDAAGITHPITGAGIANGIISGVTAAAIISKNLQRGRRGLEEYEQEIQTLFGKSHALALMNRKYQEEHWNSNPELLTRVIKNTWIAFSSYSHRKRGEVKCKVAD
ncbi:MAG: NAD(P)/FAD-dependent oxidoreductase [Clostridia bacterium]|nr:NAD(P)/FAD-dependent oxidoreductase [Clostridia bacterium]